MRGRDGSGPGPTAPDQPGAAARARLWHRHNSSTSWSALKLRFGIELQHCPNCGAGELKIIAAILERPVIEKILTHLGLDPQPPPKGRAREAGHD